MIIEEIRKGAPEGDCFYHKKYGYLKMVYNEWYLWNGREFNVFYMPIFGAVKIVPKWISNH